MDFDDIERKHKFIIAIVCIAAAVIALSWAYRGVDTDEERDIEPVNVSSAGETKKEVRLSSHEVAIYSDNFEPREIEINIESAEEGEVSKGQIKFTNNGSKSRSVTIVEEGGTTTSSFTVPPGSKRRQPFFSGEEGEYRFGISGFNTTGTITVS
ncbi:MAG: hypothetical protein ACLFM9_04260 [Candidatus Aenigmatarchaeota archaeon]